MKELKNNFEIAQTTHAEKLQALRMRDQDLAKFNEQFAKLAIGAKQMLTSHTCRLAAGLAPPPTASAASQGIADGKQRSGSCLPLQGGPKCKRRAAQGAGHQPH